MDHPFHCLGYLCIAQQLRNPFALIIAFGKMLRIMVRYHCFDRCRTLGEVENRNAINCFVASDKLASFPYCCPHIECERRNMTSVPTLPGNCRTYYILRNISPSRWAFEGWEDGEEGIGVRVNNAYKSVNDKFSILCFE